jgi:hypothetical protein
MTISGDDVRQLLQAETTAVLVLVEGRIEVVTATELDSDAYRGALEVISREDLLKRTGGTELSEHELAEQAGVLDAAVSELGG